MKRIDLRVPDETKTKMEAAGAYPAIKVRRWQNEHIRKTGTLYHRL